MPQLCNRCFRTTDEDFDTCPSKDSPLPCPPPVEVSDDMVVIVHCGACPKTRAIPIGNVMQRRRLTELGTCVSDQCQARVVLPVITRPAVPPRITGNERELVPEETREQFREWDREGLERALDNKDISQEDAERLLIELDSGGK